MTRNIIRRPFLVTGLALAVAGCDPSSLLVGGGSTVGDAPTVISVVVPETVRPNGILEVEINAAGVDGITSVEVTLVEDVVRERTLTIDPPETELNEFTEFQLPATITRGSVLVRVEVEDQRGRRSDPVEVEVAVIRDFGR